MADADTVDWPAWPDAIAERVVGVLLRCPCTWGSCGHCTNGDHDQCAWVRTPAGPNGTETFRRDRTTTHIVNRKGFAVANVYVTSGTHEWHCRCDRDGHGQPVQLDLLNHLAAL
ncbi:DUF6248 family natural product biosynthesis protein [Brachybacterium phenoliresistens]|uniref:DUF6248 family natural product biosynthesis protein n=1 Tax=Brachybacterium phenoliresistens TaxID=396014 RepID=UPI0031D99989